MKTGATISNGKRTRVPLVPDRLASGDDDAIAAPPLAEAKLAAPRVRGGVLSRPRIMEALDAGRDGASVLVAAPAGYGKTTAVRTWCAGLDAALAWVTLDAGDNDPARLWRYVAHAVDRVRPGLGRRAVQRLGAAGNSIEDTVDELLNGASAFDGRIVIVLDDLQTVTERDSLQSLDHALAHLPSNTRVVAISRADPALSLSRLRVADALVELRADGLAFTPAEAYELLVERGRVNVGREEIATLVTRTEGWPAALVLAGLWLKTLEDPSGALRRFGGEHRFVAEYLSDEVLASLDRDRRSFLLGIAVLGEFTPELCDAVLGRSGSAARLVELERENLLVQRLERGGWYRIHSLFAQYARAQLASEEPAIAASIDRRAAEWLRARGLPVEAVAHAAAAGDHELVADVLAEHHLAMIRGGNGRTLLRWARTLSDEVLAAHPEVAASGALATVVVGGRMLEHRRYLEIADAASEGGGGTVSPYLEVAVSVAHTLGMDAGVTQAVRDGRRAVELAHAGGLDEATSGALAGYARALYFAGDLDEASAAAARVLENPRIRQRLPSLMHAHTTLALVDVDRGRLSMAHAHATEAKAAVGTIRVSRSWLGANASAALGAVLVAEGHLAEAEHELTRAVHLFDDEVPTVHHTWALVLLARLRVGRGHLDDAEAALQAAEDALGRLADTGRVADLARDVRRELDALRSRAGTGEVLEPPSDAELAVLQLLATDLSTREIGEQLFLSVNTIRSHRRALYHKLGVHDRAGAVARASALGLIDQA